VLSIIPSGKDSSGEKFFCKVRDVLQEKHPLCKPANQETRPTASLLLDSSDKIPHHDPILFECLSYW